MRVGEALRALERRLAAAGVPAPGVDAELLFRHVLRRSRASLLVTRDQPLPPAELAELAELAERRARREPLQLLVGSVGFRRLEIQVRPGVFIPRPETEVLAGAAIDRTPDSGLVVEPCTGTGAVACAIADERRDAAVLASDSSQVAVDLARDNARRAGLTLSVVAGDLLDAVPDELRGRVDVLVSNPPYLAERELDGLEPEVVDWDPHAALVAGPTGHEVSDRLIAAATEWLAPGGWLLLEVDPTRAAETARRMRGAGLAGADVVADLAGLDRVVLARRRRGGG